MYTEAECQHHPPPPPPLHLHFGRSGKQSEHMQALHGDDGRGPRTPRELVGRHNPIAAM